MPPKHLGLSSALDRSDSQRVGGAEHSSRDAFGETGVRVLLIVDGHPGIGIAIQCRDFPELHVVDNRPAYTVTLQNARSSQGTLQTMLIIALIGMPSSSATPSRSTGSSEARSSWTRIVIEVRRKDTSIVEGRVTGTPGKRPRDNLHIAFGGSHGSVRHHHRGLLSGLQQPPYRRVGRQQSGLRIE